VRYSGTEPKLRIMLEGEDEETIRKHAHELAEMVRNKLG
jgi:phosphoglucosamine mutase